MIDTDTKLRQTGSQLAFRELFDQYHVKVLNTCFSLLHNRQDAEDVAQEVFVTVYQSLPAFRNQSSVNTWIYRIAINKSLNLVRKKKRWKFFVDFEDFFRSKQENNFKAPEGNQLEYSEEKRLLHQAIDQLPEKQRIAFILFKYEELPQKHVAEIMNCSIAAIEALIFRAKQNLQKSLHHYIKGEF